MRALDWVVLLGSLAAMVLYGVWKGRGTRNIEGFLLANQSLPWYSVGLSIMATQASAITFLSAPGQAYADGMRFVQFYFGLPVAMVVLSVTAVPLYKRLRVYTAYEYLEGRFDLRTRVLAASLFLLQRSLATGLTVYAPALILSVILGWNITITNWLIGGLVIAYTVSGGSKGVAYTQLGQAAIILAGMGAAFWVMVYQLPADVSLGDAVRVAGKAGKLNVVDLSFDPNSRYNVWTGLVGGFFLALSYFGTDQSQVGRYLAGASVTQSRLGLLMNGMVKIPMQFAILFIGAVLFVFYQFAQPPLFFNTVLTEQVRQSPYAAQYRALEAQHATLHETKQQHVRALAVALRTPDTARVAAATALVRADQARADTLRQRATDLLQQHDARADVSDSNYVFLTFVTHYLPAGLVGLLIAVVFAASMGATSSAINALASTTLVDIYQRSVRPQASESHYLRASRVFTVGWGLVCIGVAQLARGLGNLLEKVNELGSLFYGAILGIFLVAFYLKSVRGSATFYAALVTEAVVLLCYRFTSIAFLWYNVIGCLLVVALAWLFAQLAPAAR